MEIEFNKVSRTIILNLLDRSDPDAAPLVIRSEEHLLVNCGQTLKNLIQGDHTNPEFTLKLPSLACKKLLYTYFRLGWVTFFREKLTQNSCF